MNCAPVLVSRLGQQELQGDPVGRAGLTRPPFRLVVEGRADLSDFEPGGGMVGDGRPSGDQLGGAPPVVVEPAVGVGGVAGQVDAGAAGQAAFPVVPRRRRSAGQAAGCADPWGFGLGRAVVGWRPRDWPRRSRSPGRPRTGRSSPARTGRRPGRLAGCVPTSRGAAAARAAARSEWWARPTAAPA